MTDFTSVEYLERDQKRKVKPYLVAMSKAYANQDGFRFQGYWMLITRMLRGFKLPSHSTLTSDFHEEGRLGLRGNPANVQSFLIDEVHHALPEALQEEAEGITGDPVDILSQEVDVKRAHSLRCIGRGAIYIALILAIKADRRCDIAVAVEPEQMEDALCLWSHVQKLALVWDLALCGSLRIRCVNRDVESLSAFFGSASIVYWNPKDDAGTPRCSTMA